MKLREDTMSKHTSYQVWPSVTQDRFSESTSRALALSTSDMDNVQLIEVILLCVASVSHRQAKSSQSLYLVSYAFEVIDHFGDSCLRIPIPGRPRSLDVSRIGL